MQYDRHGTDTTIIVTVSRMGLHTHGKICKQHITRSKARVVGTRWQNKKRPQERGAGQVLSSTMQRVSECFEHRPLAIEKVRHRELRQDGASVIVPARSTQYQTAEMTGDWSVGENNSSFVWCVLNRDECTNRKSLSNCSRNLGRESDAIGRDHGRRT